MALFCAAFIYARGWLRVRKALPHQFSEARLLAFLLGLVVLFVALESPLDAFSSLLLQAHMVQHLLLIMVAPPLLLLGQPMLPILRGLPRSFVKQGLGPFLRWRRLQKFGAFLVSPLFAWVVFNLSTVGWHVPFFYELTLHSTSWHQTEHAVFFWTAILFWWPVILPWPSRPQWNNWAVVPYLLSADIVNTVLSATFVFSDKILYPTYAAAPLGSISPRSDQTTAGAIMWVPGSMVYLVPAVVLAMKLLGRSTQSRHVADKVRPQSRSSETQTPARQTFDLLKIPLIGSFLRWRHARTAMQIPLLLGAVALIVDGFRGPQMAPMNLAGLVPWIHWRAVLIIVLLAAGNFFCMACPFMLPRSLAKKVFPGRWRWPSFLRSKWLALALVGLYLWAYEAFDLWNSPAATAWIVIAYFAAALVVDSLFRDASFCKYVCPIGQFNFIGSLVSPLEVKVHSQKTCQSCQTYDCIRGNEKQKGCELYLFQPKKESNLDCTFCLDCVHACPHDNVGLISIIPASTLVQNPYRSSIGKLSKRRDLAALALAIVFGAFANALAMVSSFTDWENKLMQWMPKPAIIALLIVTSVIFAPWCASWLSIVAGRFRNQTKLFRKQAANVFAFALVPLGVTMWAAHLLFHFSTGLLGIVPVLERVFNILFKTALTPDWALSAQPVFTNAVTPLQLILLDAGFLLTLYLSWRLAKTWIPANHSVLRLFLPWAAIAGSLYVAGVWILLQPMQMRGMMMN